MNYYALLHSTENHAIRIFEHSRDDLHVVDKNHVKIESLDLSYYGRIYDRENQCWTDEYWTQPEPEPTQLDRIEEQVNAIANSENSEAINALLGG